MLNVQRCSGIALLTAAMILGASALSQPLPEPIETNPAKGDQGAASDQRGTDKAPLIIKVLPPEPNEEESKGQQKDRDEKARLDRNLVDYTAQLAVSTDSLAYYTGGLAIATTILVLATVGLLCMAVRQARDMKASILAAQQAADAAKGAVELSDRNAVKELRAYVFVELGLNDMLASHRNEHVAIKARNAGKTPAHDVRGIACIKIHERDFAVSVEKEQRPDIGAKFVVNPDTSVVFYHVTIAHQEVSAGLADGKSAIFVYGCITYVDVFEQSRTTRFRLICRNSDFGDVRNFSPCEEGNAAN